jgi:hypothetical protein
MNESEPGMDQCFPTPLLHGFAQARPDKPRKTQRDQAEGDKPFEEVQQGQKGAPREA